MFFLQDEKKNHLVLGQDYGQDDSEYPKTVEEIDRFTAGSVGPSIVMQQTRALCQLPSSLVLDGLLKLLESLAVSVCINELTWSQKIGGKTIDPPPQQFWLGYFEPSCPI